MEALAVITGMSVAAALAGLVPGPIVALVFAAVLRGARKP